jgi:glutathione S-transferase
LKIFQSAPILSGTQRRLENPMKLYFAPMTCSLSPHIVLRELDIAFGLIQVDNKTKRTADGEDFLAINPKGYVAALMYLADQVPGNHLAPANGTWERVRLQEWLNFISSEIHGGCAPLFNAEILETTKAIFKQKLFRRLDYLAGALEQHRYLQGDFSLADAYLFSVLKWLPFFAIDIEDWPPLASYMARIDTRPSVMAAIEAEANAGQG